METWGIIGLGVLFFYKFCKKKNVKSDFSLLFEEINFIMGARPKKRLGRGKDIRETLVTDVPKNI